MTPDRPPSRLMLVLGAIVLIQAVVIAVSPDTLLETVDWGTSQWLAGSLRVAFGVALFIAAADSRFPRALKAFGALVTLAGLAIPFIPHDIWREAIEHWITSPKLHFRASASTGCAVVAAVLLYSAKPPVRPSAPPSTDP